MANSLLICRREFTTKMESKKGIIFFEDIAPEIDKPLGKDGKTMRREELQKMLQDYYALRNWSAEGIPKQN